MDLFPRLKGCIKFVPLKKNLEAFNLEKLNLVPEET